MQFQIQISHRTIVASISILFLLRDTDGFGPSLSFASKKVNRDHHHLLATTDASQNDGDASAFFQGDDSSFDDLGLSLEVLNALKSHSDNDWIEPTPIQSLAVPQLVLSSTEQQQQSSSAVWCQAPTGAGKTLAFALPLLHNILHNGAGTPGKVTALILCPTRELCTQIGIVLKDLVQHVERQQRSSNNSNHRKKHWTIATVYGGVRREAQIAQLAGCIRHGEPIDIVVATPGRLVDVLKYYSDADATSATDAALESRLLDAMADDDSLSLDQITKLKLDRLDDDGRGSLTSLLDNLEYLVLDEADRLTGRGFQTEMDGVLNLLPTVNNNDKAVSPWLFSATFPKHSEPRIDAILKRIHGGGGRTNVPPPIRISCTNSDRLAPADQNDGSASLSKKLQTVATKTHIEQIGPASTIDLQTIRLEKRDRTQALRSLLEEHLDDWDRVLVFCSTRYAAEHVSRKLRRVGIQSAELHGKLDQDARARRLDDLKRGKIRVLLATDVASRGLDIVGLPLVVNYDLPRSTADFVHRVGRTGRAGRAGTAVTFCTSDTEAHLDLIESRHLSTPVERTMLQGFEIDEEKWKIEAQGSRLIVPGAIPSEKGLAHDRMFGGIKGRRKSKKDKLREKKALGEIKDNTA